MGQIHCFRGRHQESVAWIEKAMRLNPYHPESLWLYLGRALFHQGRYGEVVSAIGKLTKPGLPALAYRVAASACLEDSKTTKTFMKALREVDTAFDPESFTSKSPYEHEQDRRALVDALRTALSD